MLWNAITKASNKRSASGNGYLEIVWIPSHTSFETAVNKGYSPSLWLSNQLAGKLAADAASRHQLDGSTCQNLADSTHLSHCIMWRLVGVMSHLANSATYSNLGSLAFMEPKVPKYQQVSEWAKQAGHALDTNFKCVRCQLQLNMSRSLAFLDLVLNM